MIEMENQDIINRLLSRFNTPAAKNSIIPRIVFWSDPSKEFVDSIDDMDLGDIKLLKWDGFNSFHIKYIVECEQPESKFVIYVPGNMPEDKDNILADMVHYSIPMFSADKASSLCVELGIPENRSDVISSHLSFFNSAERRRKFEKVDVDVNDSDSIVNGMIAVSLGTGSCDFKDILRSVLIQFSNSPGIDSDDEMMSNLEKYDLVEDFWSRCHSIVGFEGKSIGDLVRSMFITAATMDSTLKSSPKLSHYILPRGNVSTAIVIGLMSDSRVSEQICSLSDWIEEKVGIHKILEAFDNNAFADADVFQCFDDVLFHRLSNQICSTRSALDHESISIITKRKNKERGKMYLDRYEMLLAASNLVSKCTEFNSHINSLNSAKDVLEDYSKRWYLVDTYYRQFIFYSDKFKDDVIAPLIGLVENTYSNMFVNPIVDRLCSFVYTYSDLPGPPLTEFCKRYISSDRKTVVIISDAFRYECAADLEQRLGKSSRFRDHRLEYMTSTVPSITKFGMAALLPNDGLQVSHDGKYNVLIRGVMTDSGYRETILQSVYPDSIVLSYKQFKTSSSSELREICKGKNLIYIYHDSIDSAGHGSQGYEAFDACERAFQEISDLITTVTNWNYTKFIITADHGFLYRRGKIEEFDKIGTVDGFEQDRRYALNNRSFNLDRSIEMPLDYLDVSNEGLYVSVPDSAGVFKIQGAGMNFVHGGISPQEVVVPVLTVHSFKGSVSESYVGLIPDARRDIKQMKPRFILWQEHPVDGLYREAQYEIWVEDENSQIISPKQIVNANKSDASALEHRVTFPIEIKGKTVYLIIKNHTDPDEESKRYEFNVKVIYGDLL